MLDDLDKRLLDLLYDDPQVGVLGASRALKVARATVQARLDRMKQRGIIASTAPVLSPEKLGYPVTAFVTLSITQRSGHKPVLAHLRSIAEVLEVHTITGDGDLFVRVVASSNADLQRVIDHVVGNAHVVRTSTVISLSELLPYRTQPLVSASSQATL